MCETRAILLSLNVESYTDAAKRDKRQVANIVFDRPKLSIRRPMAAFEKLHCGVKPK